MHPISILVAAHDPYLRECLRRAMGVDPELRVEWEAENGLQALVLADRHQPDLVLLDAEMPRMDGFETARCLRQRRADVRIVIMSVYEHLRSQAEEAGADAFVVKDCGCSAFRSVVRGVLNNNKDAAAQL